MMLWLEKMITFVMRVNLFIRAAMFRNFFTTLYAHPIIDRFCSAKQVDLTLTHFYFENWNFYEISVILQDYLIRKNLYSLFEQVTKRSLSWL